MSYRLHPFVLPETTDTVILRLGEDFVVVSGLGRDGHEVLPTCETPSYICPSGVLGLPYLPRLGEAGRVVRFNFPVPVVQVQVATFSDFPPLPVVDPPPAPQPLPDNVDGDIRIAFMGPVDAIAGFQYFELADRLGDRIGYLFYPLSKHPEMSPGQLGSLLSPQVVGRTARQAAFAGFSIVRYRPQ